MKRIKGHDTGSLVIPKVSILEAHRLTGVRQAIVEVFQVEPRSAPEVLSYVSHLAKYGFPLEPGHVWRFENYAKPQGFPVPAKDDDGDGEEKEHGRAFLRPPLGNKNAPSLPVLREGGQGEGGQRGRDKEPRKRGRRPRNPLLHRLLTRAHLETLCADHTQAQIAQEVGCSKGYLCLKLKDFGLKAVSGHLPKTDQDQEIIRLAKTKTIGELAEHFGKSRTTIFQKLARLGITAVRGTPGKPKGRKP
jgi:AraC-like DNA-binding protein